MLRLKHIAKNPSLFSILQGYGCSPALRGYHYRRKTFTNLVGQPAIVVTAGCQVVIRKFVSTVIGTENHMDHRRRKRCIQGKASVLLAMIFRVSLSMLRARQTKREHFVVSGSLDFPVTGSPIDGAIHD
jgi:hypothetical protein